jgi:hypothetical protein
MTAGTPASFSAQSHSNAGSQYASVTYSERIGEIGSLGSIGSVNVATAQPWIVADTDTDTDATTSRSAHEGHSRCRRSSS